MSLEISDGVSSASLLVIREIMAEIKLAKILLDRPAPHVTASSWVVLDRNTRQVFFGKLEKDRREIASLTKIMTIYTVLQICDRFKIPYQLEQITIT